MLLFYVLEQVNIFLGNSCLMFNKHLLHVAAHPSFLM
ncbi:unnamed protein product [Ectocarpus sp. 12 AP-2014]